MAELLDRKFEFYEFGEKLDKALGTPERSFNMILWGQPGSGKTIFTMHCVVEFTTHGRCYYNHIESGESLALKRAVEFVNPTKQVKDKCDFGHKDTFEEMVKKINEEEKRQHKNRYKFILIDSWQYLRHEDDSPANLEDYLFLKESYPDKALIIISHAHEKTGKPLGEDVKRIHYDSDIKVPVRNGVARCQSRFGGGHLYYIFGEPEYVTAQKEKKKNKTGAKKTQTDAEKDENQPVLFENTDENN